MKELQSVIVLNCEANYVRKNVRIVCRIVSAPFRHDHLNVTLTATGKVGIL
jgi:hypothetical protein